MDKFKERLLETIEENRLEMLMPSRDYSEEELGERYICSYIYGIRN